MYRKYFILLVLAALPALCQERLFFHAPKLDTRGRLAPWYGSGPPEAYDHVVRQTFYFWLNMRNCPNGVPYYMQHQVWWPDREDERGLGGDQINMALSAWNLLYGYLGDEAVKKNMVFQANYWIDHGMAKSSDPWGDLPYPYNVELHSGLYDGDMRAGKGYLQPDKAASFGAELVTLYKMTGNPKFLKVATAIADRLSRKVQPGGADNSPWPYRVHATNGDVHTVTKDGKKHVASYTTNWTGALLLFDALKPLKQGDTNGHTRAREAVVAWLKAYPIETNKWGPFFEDVPTEDWSDTEINADTLAMYILEHPEFSQDWQRMAAGILDWSYRTLGNKEFTKYGVEAINEQTAYRVPGNSHTSRHASVELLYCEKTGDIKLKEDAIHRLNWATYTVDVEGGNRYPRDDYWLTDGYGDYIRHYLRAMASFPELAPNDQNHLLRTTSVVQSITYGADRITYSKFDATSRERFKLGAWTPKAVNGGTMKWDPAGKVLEVSATRKSVTITR